MQYIFAAMWLAVGALLIISLSKENKIYIIAGCYFITLGIWWLLNVLWEGIMFKGMLGIGFKVFSGIILVILLLYMLRHRRAAKNNQDIEGK